MIQASTRRSRTTTTARFTSIAVLLAFASCANAPPSRDLVQEFYERSGLASRVAHTAELVSQGVAQQHDRIGADALASADRSIRSAYAPASLETAVVRGLHERWNVPQANATLHWLRSRPGRRISRRAAEAASPEGTRSLQEFASRLRADPPPESRLAQARRFEDAANGADFLVDLTLTTSLGIALALNASLPDEQQADPVVVRSDIEARRDGFRKILGSAATIVFLYSVRESSDAEVDRAVAFAESDAGRWYERTVSRAYLDALAAASRSIAETRGD